MEISLRKLILENIIKDIHGPRKGSEEVLEDVTDVSNEYITGSIIPEECNVNESPERQQDPSEPPDDSENDEYKLSDQGRLSPLNRPSLFSISFKLSNDSAILNIFVTYGMYKKTDINTWKRTPFKWAGKIEFSNFTAHQFQISSNEQKGQIVIQIEKIEKERIVIISLINKLEPATDENITEFTLFQPSIRINIENGELESNTKIDDKLSFMYRDKKIFGRGYMCSVIWRDIDYSDFIDPEVLWPDGLHFEAEDFLKCDIRTEFIPVVPVSSPIVRSEELSNNFEGIELSPFRLSDMYQKGKIYNNFKPVISRYNEWIGRNEKEIGNDRWVNEIVGSEKKFLEKFKYGLEVIDKNEDARLAFSFANRAVWFQNKEMKWYPFQIAYIISVIPSLVDSNDREAMELLSIPTGGGKTETYLFLTVFISCYRRLKYGDYGTSVFSRYTLRLLTIQQFRRAVKILTASEYIRVSNWVPSDYDGHNQELLFGKMRYSVGLWVGNAITPHLLRNGKDSAIELLSKTEGTSSSEAAQLLKCPFCNTYLSLQGNSISNDEFTMYLTFKYVKNTDLIKPEIDKNILKDENEPVNGMLKSITIRELQEQDIIVLNVKKPKQAGINEIKRLFSIINNILDKNGSKFLPLSITNLGYFGFGEEPDRQSDKIHYLDFDIYCPNPDCILNKDINYIEYEPGENDMTAVKRNIAFYGKRVPLTAYTVDEQLYSHPPSIVIGTVDKLARMAYDPLIATLIGNVTGYNKNYGYFRDNIYFSDITEKGKKDSVKVSGFRPPDLIIQDELHLIEGPLGSMVGIYENMLDSLLIQGNVRPKYIASTATIKGGEEQVKRIFNREMVEFPPYGKDLEDSFFIKYRNLNELWNENTPGKIYTGICAPGTSQQTLYIRIMASMITSNMNMLDSKYIKNYWTLVNYFNSIKELGIGESLIEEDIKERLQSVGVKNTDIVYSHRELSSRIQSIELPNIIEELNSMKDNYTKNNPVALFVTSMFGTGIDLPVLSSMIVYGQPKSTSQYIQASGRIGRSHGGIVITLLSAVKPRDLSHYELFPEYHLRTMTEVENISVSPFSAATVSRGAGPVIVSFLRNMRNPHVDWFGENAEVINDMDANEDITNMNKIMNDRITQAGGHSNLFDEEFHKWKDWKFNPESKLYFNKYEYMGISKTQQKYDVVLGNGFDEYQKTIRVIYHNSPQSLRDIDETMSFLIYDHGKIKETQSIRQPQFIYNYGPGSIIETTRGSRLVYSLEDGLRRDARYDLTSSDKLYERKINNNNLLRFIQKLDSGNEQSIELFEIPTNESEKISQDEYIYRTREFPLWKICYNTDGHKNAGHANILFKPINEDNPSCPLCPKSQSNKFLSAVRFISVCEDGHMDDLPWNYLVHQSEECRPDYFEWRAKGSSTSDISIKCPDCGTVRSMADIYGLKKIKCSGNFPERKDSKKEDCKKRPKITQRQASNVRYPFTVTLLNIPENIDDIEKVITNPSFKNIYSNIESINTFPDATENQKIDALNRFLSTYSDLSNDDKCILKNYVSSNGISMLAEKYKDIMGDEGKVEFMSLINKEYNSINNFIKNGEKNENFLVNPNAVERDLDSYGLSMKIYRIGIIKTVTCNIGYRRLKPDGKILYSSINIPSKNKKYYPAFNGTGEGIFFKINVEERSRNEKSEKQSTFRDGNELWDFQDPALFIKIHTLTHAIIKAISLKSGYSSSALRERVYIGPEGNEAGILIYTSSPGEDGSLGGLTEQVDNIDEILKYSMNIIKHCSNDPLCREIKNYDNGSACYSCVMLSETSCEHLNTGLDRTYFIDE